MDEGSDVDIDFETILRDSGSLSDRTGLPVVVRIRNGFTLAVQVGRAPSIVGEASGEIDSKPQARILRRDENYNTLVISVPAKSRLVAPARGPRPRARPAARPTTDDRRHGHSGRRLLLRAHAAVLLLALVVGPQATRVKAQPIRFRDTATLRTSSAPVAVEVTSDGRDTHVAVGTGRRASAATFSGTLSSARVETVSIDAEQRVALVWAETSEGHTVTLVVVRHGHPEIAWSGRLSMRGDPGERSADAIETEDRTGDGRPDVVVGRRHEGVGLCGEPPALLYPRALDPSSLTLRPVDLRRGSVTDELQPLVGAALSPGPSRAPLLHAMTAMVASSQMGAGEDESRPEPPRALVDGNLGSAWIEGRGGAGEHEFAVLRFGAGRPIRAFALTAPGIEGTRLPTRLVLAGEAGPRFSVTIPPGLERVWVVPPEPVNWSCISVMLAERGGAPDVRVGFAELEAYTDVDFDGGLDVLVSAIVRNDADADRAATLLSRLGAPAAEALGNAWDRLDTRGRERACRIARSAELVGTTAAVELLARGATDEDSGVRSAAFAGLTQSGPDGRRRLAEVAAAANGEGAALALVECDGDYPIGALLAAAEAGTDRPNLRRAIARGILRAGAEAEAEFARWTDTASSNARASVALGLSAESGGERLAASLVRAAWNPAAPFEERYRWTRAAARVSEGSEALLRWIEENPLSAEEWMLRAEALRALHGRSAAATTRGLEDPYPRVRLAAVDGASGRSDTSTLRARSAHEDPWPMVRAAALATLAGDDGATLELRAALADGSPLVRARAVDVLTQRRDADAADEVVGLIRRESEAAGVVEAGLRYVESLCVIPGADAAIAVLRRGVRPDARELDADQGIRALRTLLVLGGPAAAAGRSIAEGGGDAFRAALSQAAPVECGLMQVQSNVERASP